MSRNPHATNLRHHKPKRIEDKREVAGLTSLDDWLRDEGWLEEVTRGAQARRNA